MTLSYNLRKFRRFLSGVFAVGKWKSLKEAATFIYIVSTVFLIIVGAFLFSFISYIMGYEVFVPLHTMPRAQILTFVTIFIGMVLIDILVGTFFVWLYDKLIMMPTATIIKEISDRLCSEEQPGSEGYRSCIRYALYF